MIFYGSAVLPPLGEGAIEVYLAMMERDGHLFCGQVQGVGFRPFVYRVARRLGLTGFVGNTSEGVRVEVQGGRAALDAFARALENDLPPLARVTSRRRTALPPVEGESGFRIVGSQGQGGHTVLVSPDVATCAACLADIRDPRNRRYGYAFTNCTDCGPRYTITRSIPYDRAVTSMSCFPLCPACRAEYENPGDRRFHAQPNACPVCGPQLRLIGDGGPSDGFGPDAWSAEGADPIGRAAAALAQGRIVAIKGLGGFLLACDAQNATTVAELRRRKRRPHKALAIMVGDMESARRIARLTLEEEALLAGPERPVVVARRRAGALPGIIAPDVADLGIMLPCTPLHYLLLEAFARVVRAGRGQDDAGASAALVMTSGNAGGEPIALGNREALERLAGIADLFLAHNRDILIRADDSVVRLVRPVGGDAPPERHFLRRARGFVPRPAALAPLPQGASRCVLAVGGELQNTLCLTRGGEAFVSQHVGDLKNPETFAFFRETAAHLMALLEVRPEAVARDAHPDLLSSVFAEEYGRAHGVPVLRLQHHFAHIYSVLAEHGHTGPAVGLALDGTGLGDDGTIWGGELLLVRPEAVSPAAPSPGRRIGRLAPFPLPGGDMAVREPWRLARALLTLGENEASGLPAGEGPLLCPGGTEAGHAAVAELVRADLERRARGERGLMPWTSSCGRLFDAVSALLGLCDVISYEGQAAIRLEQAQDRSRDFGFGDAGQAARGSEGAPLFLRESPDGLFELDTLALFRRVADLCRSGCPVGETARRFHLMLGENLAELARIGAARAGVEVVALSGGVLHNVTLARHVPEALRRRGLTPLLHRDFPPGDGGLCLGQADWARRALGAA